MTFSAPDTKRAGVAKSLKPGKPGNLGTDGMFPANSQPFIRKRQTKRMDDVFAAQASGVRSAMRWSGVFASPGRMSAR